MILFNTNNIRNFTFNISSVRVDKFIFYLCVFDILFFPYVRILSVSLSMLVLPVWYSFRFNKIRIDNELRISLIAIALISISYLWALAFQPNMADFLRESSINTGIVLYLFAMYFFFKYCFSNLDISIKFPLVAYVLFGFFLAVIYTIAPSYYFIVRSFWTMSGEVIEFRDFSSMVRYTGTLSDPNNVAVIFCSILSYLLYNEHIGRISCLLLFGMGFLIIGSTMSSTGFIAFSFVLTVTMFTSLNFKSNAKRIFFNIFSLILVFTLLISVLPMTTSSELGQVSINRVIDNSAGSRIDIWKSIVSLDKIFDSLLIGDGGTIFVDGDAIKPHNGHLYLLFNYGVFSYLVFILIFFRKRMGTTIVQYLCTVPIFLGFTINVGIYEPRFAGIMALLIASCARTRYSAHIKKYSGKKILRL